MLSHRNLLAMGSAACRVTSALITPPLPRLGPLFHIGNYQFGAIPAFVHGGKNVSSAGSFRRAAPT